MFPIDHLFGISTGDEPLCTKVLRGAA